MNIDDDNVGGGSGGDAGMTKKGHVTKSAKGAYQIGGNQVVLVSRARVETDPPTDPKFKTDPGPSKIILLATGTATKGFIDDGTVEVRGVKGVSVTSGPIELPQLSPPVSSDDIDGIELVASEKQSIKLHRGLIDGTDQKIEMTPLPPPGAILIDGGKGPVTVQSAIMITLQVGESSIIITPESIVINSKLVSVTANTFDVVAQSQASIIGSDLVSIIGGMVTIN
jgi:hypothetical protein